MLSEQTTENIAKQVLRCDERDPIRDHGGSLSPSEKKDAMLKSDVAAALWKDDVLRALDFYEIDIHVKNSVVALNGYISSSGSQNRIWSALQAISGIAEIKNNLILDDKLTFDVAASLGNLEHTYGCKFFTGASHGVISVSGKVNNEKIKLLAERCASDTPFVRGVMNNIQVDGKKQEFQITPFLQPVIGQTIYFLDWVSGVVKQVIMNPSDRRVIAMVAQGKFTSQQDELNSMNDGSALPPERLVVIPMDTVRHLTKTSGFLNINSNQRNHYIDFFPPHFISPPQSWVPPYPYCPEDVLFPLENDEKYTWIE